VLVASPHHHSSSQQLHRPSDQEQNTPPQHQSRNRHPNYILHFDQLLSSKTTPKAARLLCLCQMVIDLGSNKGETRVNRLRIADLVLAARPDPQ